MKQQMKLKDMTPAERRAYDRARKQKQRTRDKKEREQYEAELDKRELAEVYRNLNLHYLGEEAPGIDACSFEAELAIHREFLRAMGQPDVQPGETLRQLAERTWRGWNDMITSWLCVDGRRVLPQKSPGFARAFCRDTQNFHGFYGFDTIKSIGVPFEEMWRPPNGCTGDESIDISKLPPLPYRASKPAESAAEPEVEVRLEVTKVS
jgi:hypothetical protein